MADGEINVQYPLRANREPTPIEIIKAKIEVMKEVQGVGKTGQNKFHGYIYSSDYDVMKAVQPAMAKHGLALEMFPEAYGVDPHGNCYVDFLMQWQHIEGHVSPLIPWRGLANDKDKQGNQGDKWFNKCATSAEKYFLIKQFHIPTSEKENDPDGDGHAVEQHQPQQRRAPEQPQELTPEDRAKKIASYAIEAVNGAKTVEALDAFHDKNSDKINGIRPVDKSLFMQVMEAFSKRREFLLAHEETVAEVMHP